MITTGSNPKALQGGKVKKLRVKKPKAPKPLKQKKPKAGGGSKSNITGTILDKLLKGSL